MKFIPEIHRHASFENNFGTRLANALCLPVLDQMTLATHQFSGSTVDYVYSTHILDANSPIKSVVLARVSALDLLLRATQDKRHFILQTDYALTVQFDSVLITYDSILHGIQAFLDETMQNATCRIQIGYLQDNQLCVVINFDITEAFLQGVVAQQAMTGWRGNDLCAPFNVEYLFTKVLPGPPALVQDWTRHKQEALFYASQLPVPRPGSDYSKRRADIHLRSMIRGAMFDDRKLITTLAADCVENNIDSDQFLGLNSYISERVEKLSQLATLYSIKEWVNQVRDRSRWANAKKLLNDFDSVHGIHEMTGLTVSSKYLYDTPITTLFQEPSLIMAHRHFRCFGHLNVDNIKAYTTFLCKYFVLRFNQDLDLSAIGEALSEVNQDDPAFITFEELGYTGSPQWLLVRYYAIATEPSIPQEFMEMWSSRIPSYLYSRVYARKRVLEAMGESELRTLEQEILLDTSDAVIQDLQRKRNIANNCAEKIQQDLILDWFSRVLNEETANAPDPMDLDNGELKGDPLRRKWPRTIHRTMWATLPVETMDVTHGPTPMMMIYPTPHFT